MEQCRYTGKNIYETKQDAEDAILRSLYTKKENLQPYQCNWCYKWHLTRKK